MDLLNLTLNDFFKLSKLSLLLFPHLCALVTELCERTFQASQNSSLLPPPKEKDSTA